MASDELNIGSLLSAYNISQANKKLVIGETVGIIDNSNSVKIPSFSDIKEGDTLIFAYSYDNDCIEVYSYDYYYKLIENVANSRDLDYILENANVIPELNELLDRALFKSSVINGKVSLNMTSMSRYGYKRGYRIYLFGRGNHLELYPSKEEFEEMLSRRKLIKNRK